VRRCWAKNAIAAAPREAGEMKLVEKRCPGVAVEYTNGPRNLLAIPACTC